MYICICKWIYVHTNLPSYLCVCARACVWLCLLCSPYNAWAYQCVFLGHAGTHRPLCHWKMTPPPQTGSLLAQPPCDCNTPVYINERYHTIWISCGTHELSSLLAQPPCDCNTPTNKNGSCHTIWMRHVTPSEWVMSHHLNEPCHTMWMICCTHALALWLPQHHLTATYLWTRHVTQQHMTQQSMNEACQSETCHI